MNGVETGQNSRHLHLLHESLGMGRDLINHAWRMRWLGIAWETKLRQAAIVHCHWPFSAQAFNASWKLLVSAGISSHGRHAKEWNYRPTPNTENPPKINRSPSATRGHSSSFLFSERHLKKDAWVVSTTLSCFLHWNALKPSPANIAKLPMQLRLQWSNAERVGLGASTKNYLLVL